MPAPLSESVDHKLGELPGGSARSKVEVWRRAGEDGGSLVVLVEYTWGSGLGWYRQRSMVLDAEQVDALRALLEDAPSAPASRPKRSAPPVVREDNVIRLVFPG
jgi:hypothetical protein